MIVALAGGVGGARLAHGLARALPPDSLTVIVNTGDDFDHHGLRVCPDLDTVMYTLGGLANEATGWGVAGDTDSALSMLRGYGEDTWFWLGDRDLATSLLRTERLRAGRSLTEVTAELAAALGVTSALLPMSDARVATIVDTPTGSLAFQEYFVRRRHQDTVLGIRLEGIESAAASSRALDALAHAKAVIICPSNPLLSIQPILGVGGMRQALMAAKARGAPVVAVSPIIGGQAVKGPAAENLAARGVAVSPAGITRWYDGLLDGLALDHADAALAPEISSLGAQPLVTDILMRDAPDRERLAREVLNFAARLRHESEAWT